MAETQTSVKKLFEEKDQKHPGYEDWQDSWELYRDVVGDAEVDKKKYLPRGVQEDEGLYDFRVDLSEFIPESPLAIDKLLGALFNRKPRRDKLPDAIKPFLRDADFRGHNWDYVIEEIARDLLAYGTIRVLINIKATDPGPLQLAESEGRSPTRAEEQDAGIRPFIVQYSPLSVIDWDVDDIGNLLMSRIKEERPVRSPETGAYGKRTRFIEYSTGGVQWWDFLEDDGKLVLMDTSGARTHDLGVVPMVVDYYPREIAPMVGHGLIRYSARADIQKFRAESDIAYDTHVHAHPTFWAKVSESLASIGVGSSTFLKLDPSAQEEVGYVDTPSSAFEALHRVVEERRKQIYRQANIDPMGVVESGNTIYQGSGVSRAWSFGTSEARQLSDIADVMESIEERILGLVTFMMTPAEERKGDSPFDFSGSIGYPEEFDVAAVEGLAEQTTKAGMEINSETFARTMQRRWAAALVGDIPREELDKIHKEIEDNPLIGSASQVADGSSSGPTGEVDRNKNLGTDGTGGKEQPAGANGAPPRSASKRPKGPSGPQPPGAKRPVPTQRPKAKSTTR